MRSRSIRDIHKENSESRFSAQFIPLFRGSMDTNKHVEMLAYGLGNEMLTEITNEVESLETTLNNFAIDAQSLRPESQFALKRMKGFIQEAERISASLFTIERRVGDIKRSSGIRDILDIEEKIKLCDSVHESGRLKRQILHLKSIHAKKLSDLVSNEQQVLQERLRLINIWKSILNYEIHILEECKTMIIKKIVVSANSSGDPDIIEKVRDRLRSLSVKDSVISDLRLDMSSVHIANIHILHKTLNEQLKDIDKIEIVVAEKREIVQVLNDIARDIQEQLPENLSEFPAEKAISVSNAENPKSTLSPTTKPANFDPSRTRMAIRDKNKSS